MAVRGVLGAEWDSEKVGECGVGAEGPDRAGLWDQLEEESGRAENITLGSSPSLGHSVSPHRCQSDLGTFRWPSLGLVIKRR